VRAKQSLRPESSHEPYAGFSIEIAIETFDDDDRAPATPIGDGMGRWWPAEPATEPKLRVEGSSVWPVEPPTEEKQNEFSDLNKTVPSAPRFSDLSTTRELPARPPPPRPEPPTEPRKPGPKKPSRTQRTTVRKPTVAPTDAPFDATEDDTKSFSSEADTIEGKPLDDE
jgi:hypothetical protein